MSMTAMKDVHLIISSENDAETLCHIQHAAFDVEARRMHWPGPCGPEGYDTEEGQLDLMQRTELFKIMHLGKTVGGVAMINSGNRCRLVRIFVDPSHQGKGIGRATFMQLFERYPNADMWELDTPSWSLRNHVLYESLGFRKVGETDEGDRGFRLFLYERRK
jgi:GNAT superfamily N-acetyltransferase